MSEPSPLSRLAPRARPATWALLQTQRANPLACLVLPVCLSVWLSSLLFTFSLNASLSFFVYLLFFRSGTRGDPARTSCVICSYGEYAPFVAQAQWFVLYFLVFHIPFRLLISPPLFF
jgi:hypothetical protein